MYSTDKLPDPKIRQRISSGEGRIQYRRRGPYLDVCALKWELDDEVKGGKSEIDTWGDGEGG